MSGNNKEFGTCAGAEQERTEMSAAADDGAVGSALRPMDIAWRDGRHLLLAPRHAEDFTDAQTFGGLLVAYWCTAEDQWTVRCDFANDLRDGTIIESDSHWFVGWLPLPDVELVPDEPRSAEQ